MRLSLIRSMKRAREVYGRGCRASGGSKRNEWSSDRRNDRERVRRRVCMAHERDERRSAGGRPAASRAGDCRGTGDQAAGHAADQGVARLARGWAGADERQQRHVDAERVLRDRPRHEQAAGVQEHGPLHPRPEGRRPDGRPHHGRRAPGLSLHADALHVRADHVSSRSVQEGRLPAGAHRRRRRLAHRHRGVEARRRHQLRHGRRGHDRRD